MLTATQAYQNRFLLFQPFLHSIRNRFFRDNQISLRTAAVLVLGAGLFIALYLVSLRMIGYFHSQSELGNHFVGMGRSKTPTITREDGSIYYDVDYVFTPGKADWLREGTNATIITYGALTPACIEAWKLLKQAGKSVGVLNMASLLPLDKDAVLAAAKRGPIVTVEDHHVETGLGASAAAVLIDNGLAPKMKRLGVKQYGGSGKPSDLYKQQGLDAESIAKTVLELIG